MKTSYKVIIPSIVLALGIIFIILTSLKRTDVYIRNFTVAEDSKQLTINTRVAASTGYVRSMTKSTNEDSVYLIFYPTYGFNNSLGAKDTFILDLAEKIMKIYIYRGNKQNEYQLALLKNINNDQWEAVVTNN